MQESHDPGEDARLVLVETGAWIRSADTKTGLIATALAVLVGLISQVSKEFDAYPPFSHTEEYVAFIFLATSISFSLVAYFFFYRTLIPRLQIPAQDTRFAWPWIATHSVSDLRSLRPANSRREAWEQAHTLALIAQAKFSNFRRGLNSAILAGITFILWVLVASITRR